MATDLRFHYGGGGRTAFHQHLNSADASGNGVELMPDAPDGGSYYIVGFLITNESGGALAFTVQAHAGAANHVALTPNVIVDDDETKEVQYTEPLSVGDGRSFGVVSGGAGAIGFEAWGYVAAATETEEQVSASASAEASLSASLSQSMSQSMSQSRSQSASQAESLSAYKSQSRSASRSRFGSASQSMSQSRSQSRSQLMSLSQSRSQSLSMSRSVSISNVP